ncbi:MAG: pseudouridine synthase [Firmicutes bacterium]|nr:pseudouridine synthase [Bacillota bacterium]
MRLNKYIAHSGLCSRRHADELIKSGAVSVNGDIITNIGHEVTDEDYVKVNGKNIKLVEGNVYFVLNKPVNYLSSNKDPHHELLARDLINYNGKLNSIGRLDMDSEGLMIYTNDGIFTNIMTHPSFEITKKYLVSFNEYIPDEKLKEVENGVVIDEVMTNRCKIKLKRRESKNTKIEIIISEGRNRQIRKMFEAVGYNVTGLKRLCHGEIELGELPIGKSRQFTKNELDYVRRVKAQFDGE